MNPNHFIGMYENNFHYKIMKPCILHNTRLQKHESG